MLQPHLKIKKGDISRFCIIVGKVERVIVFSEFMTDFKKVSENRGFIVYNGKYKGLLITVCNTGIGGPSAAIVIEELVNAGAKVIMRVGSGGVMRKGINTGDLVISTGVCKEEMASQAYVPSGFAAVPDYDVLKSLIESSKDLKKNYYYGKTMCTDAFYTKEHREKMKEWSKLGVVGSDMESAMLFTLAAVRGFKAGFVFYAGLNIIRGDTHEDIIKQEKLRKKGEKNAAEVALNAFIKLKKIQRR